MPRADTLETLKRTDEIARAMAEGLTTSDVMRIYGEKWKLRDRQIQNYVSKVRKRWLAESQADAKKLKAQAQAVKDRMWSEAWSKRGAENGHSWAEIARKAHNDLCQIQGIMDSNSGGNINAQGNVQIVFNVPDPKNAQNGRREVFSENPTPSTDTPENTQQ